MSIRNQIAEWCREQNLVLLGIVDLDIKNDFLNYQKWLQDSKNAGMAYLENNQHIRANPQILLEEAKSIVCVGYLYGPDIGESTKSKVGTAKIASYARLKDYHKFMRKKLQIVLDKILNEFGSFSEAGRVTVDSAPLLERAFANKTAKGFIGKNTCFIHPDHGSMMLLAEILTTLKLPYDEPKFVEPNQRDKKKGGCGSCKRCQVHCPTGALDEAYRIDANKCIAYWTIEHRGAIPQKWWPYIKDYIFGCDICQLVCPYNRKKDIPQTEGYKVLAADFDLFELATLSEEKFLQLFAGTPVMRAKYSGIRRNALIAMFTTQDHRLSKAIEITRAENEPTILQTIEQITQSY